MGIASGPFKSRRYFVHALSHQLSGLRAVERAATHLLGTVHQAPALVPNAGLQLDLVAEPLPGA